MKLTQAINITFTSNLLIFTIITRLHLRNQVIII